MYKNDLENPEDFHRLVQQLEYLVVICKLKTGERLQWNSFYTRDVKTEEQTVTLDIKFWLHIVQNLSSPEKRKLKGFPYSSSSGGIPSSSSVHSEASGQGK